MVKYNLKVVLIFIFLDPKDNKYFARYCLATIFFFG